MHLYSCFSKRLVPDPLDWFPNPKENADAEDAFSVEAPFENMSPFNQYDLSDPTSGIGVSFWAEEAKALDSRISFLK